MNPKIKKARDFRYIYKNELDEAFFNMTWPFKILRIYLEKQLPIKYCITKLLKLQKIQNMRDINADFLQWFIHFLIKKPSDGVVKIPPNKELAKELHKPIIKKFEKQKAHLSF